MEELKKIYEKHEDWISIVQSMGCNRETAKDLVSEMYIKIHLKLQNGLDIIYNDDDINYYYIFKTLRSLFLDLKRKEKKVSYVDPDVLLRVVANDDNVPFSDVYKKIQEELDSLHWYDKKVYELIDDGQSILELSKKTNIGYYSLYNTYNKVKKKLKKKL
jgi:DNA-directed RNA polymerase specialized sigma24 family protein